LRRWLRRLCLRTQVYPRVACPRVPYLSDAIPAAPPSRDQTDELEAQSVSPESAPATTTAAGAEGIVGSVLEALNNLKGERRLLGVGILALTLIVAILMAWRLPMRRSVEDPQAWGIPQQQYYENYAPSEASPEARLEAHPEAPLETSSEPANGPEGEPSGTASSSESSSVSRPPGEDEEAMPKLSLSSSSPAARGAEGSAVAGSAPGRERLRRVRHLRRIRQRRSPRRTW
jgi:hypothetical protein